MSEMPPGGNDWMEYRQYVVSALAELKTGQQRLEEGQVNMRIDIAMLKVRSGIWGGVAGFIPATIGVLAVVFGTGGVG